MGAVSEVEKYVESYVKKNNRFPDRLKLRTDFWLKFAEEQKEKGLYAYHYRGISIIPTSKSKMNEKIQGWDKLQ